MGGCGSTVSVCHRMIGTRCMDRRAGLDRGPPRLLTSSVSASAMQQQLGSDLVRSARTTREPSETTLTFAISRPDLDFFDTHSTPTGTPRCPHRLGMPSTGQAQFGGPRMARALGAGTLVDPLAEAGLKQPGWSCAFGLLRGRRAQRHRAAVSTIRPARQTDTIRTHVIGLD